MEGLGPAPLQRRLDSATRMPHRQDFQPLAAGAEVDPVVDTVDMEAANLGRARLGYRRAETRLLDKQREYALEFLADGAGSCRPIGCPPSNNPFNLASCAARDMQLQAHCYSYLRSRENSSSPVIVSPRSASAIPASSSASSSGER